MDEGAVARLAGRFGVRYEPALAAAPAALREAVGAADALIVRNATQVDAALIAAAPRLAVVGRLGVGLDNIDLAACAARSIGVFPAIGANARAVAEYVLAAALILLRGAFMSTAAVADGRWPRDELADGHEIGGRIIGLVGFGSIGRTTGALARAAGMRAIAHDPAVGSDDPVWAESDTESCVLDELLRRADVVSLHLPLTVATRGLIDARRIGLLREGAILINTSRGGIVDEPALAAALAGGRLRGAALDVFGIEPLPARSPLAGCPRLVLTPHIAGRTDESDLRVSGMVADAVTRALERSA
ncbi:MAG: 3-phosphoglycerate dehydrogenase [Proteobacteria bacterium]|jgi:(S)-sulfolactate dehydrogenase|nr:3-phosphoglycerate dehydrogenase [Pseudomonadota bacterium]